jgi:hypothetical protein
MTGSPAVTNDAAYPTRPCWTFTYRLPGDDAEHELRFYVTRQAEALSRFNAEVMTAYGVTMSFTEVPIEG